MHRKIYKANRNLQSSIRKKRANNLYKMKYTKQNKHSLPLYAICNI
jgi:hypothetical protein